MLDSLKVAYQHEQRLAKDFLCMYSRISSISRISSTCPKINCTNEFVFILGINVISVYW